MVLRLQPTGHLYLDGSRKYCVHRELASKLAIHQLEAVRFLHSQLREYTGIFLNDESGLGKCYQTVAFLSALTVNEDRSLILCPTRERLHHWTYHLDVLAPSLRTKVHPKSYADINSEQSTLRGTDWQYVVVDETRELMSDKQLELLRSLAVKRYIFVCTVDLLEQLDVLIKRLDFCYPHDPTHLRKVIEQQQRQRSKKGSFKVYLCTRRFILRRHATNYRRTLPLVERREFLNRFRAWCVANDLEIPGNITPESTERGSREGNNSTASQNVEETSSDTPLRKTMTPDAVGQKPASEQDDIPLSPVRCGQGDKLAKQTSPDHANEAVPLYCTDSEPLFEPNETNTELMPVLRVESDTPSENNSIPETCGTIPETAPDSQGYMQFGQELLSHGFSSSQPSQLALTTERYRFPIEKFLRNQGQLKSSSSSLSVESIPNGQPPQPVTEIVISSSDSPQRITKSPPLFDDSDHDTKSLNSCSSSDDDDSLMDLLASSRTIAPIGMGVERARSPSIAPRRHASFSTPITKLMFGPLAEAGGVTSQVESGNVSSVDMFAESVVAAGENAENVFEITKNNAFSNRIVVHGEEDGNASLQLVDDSSDDDVQIVDVTEGRIINLIDDIVSTPKSPDELNRAVVCQKTPPSGSVNRMLSPGRGWLGKGLRTASVSPASGKNTPTTSSKPSPCRAGCSGGGGVAGTTSGNSSSSRTKGMTPIVRDAKRRRKLDDVFQTVDDTKRGRNSQRRGSRK
uniref:SNF2 N-terminal domain-containing protein n=1 Tax=Anopheles maculatus TaxID=74869 RepID=A0A182T6U3_9DIPT